MIVRILLLLLLLTVAHQAHAQERRPPCSEIADDAARLRCYDSQNQRGERAEPPSDWQINKERSRLDDSPFVIAINTSPEGRAGAQGLAVICREGRTTFVFQSEDFLGVANPIRGAYRIDDRPPVQTTFSASTSGKGAFFRGQVIGLLRSLPEGGKIYIRVFSFNGSISEGTFSLVGITRVRDEVGNACRWPAERRP